MQASDKRQESPTSQSVRCRDPIASNTLATSPSKDADAGGATSCYSTCCDARPSTSRNLLYGKDVPEQR